MAAPVSRLQPNLAGMIVAILMEIAFALMCYLVSYRDE